ncbi:MAG: polysaccharide biosynthesis/export family protein [Cyanobacteria bacterium P01_F01_bin.150]
MSNYLMDAHRGIAGHSSGTTETVIVDKSKVAGDNRRPLFGLMVSSLLSVLTATFSLSSLLPAAALPLSPGDRIRLTIAEDTDLPITDRFSGIYEVNVDGSLQIPFIEPLFVAGFELEDVEQTLRQALVLGEFFHGDRLQLSLGVVQWAPIQVSVVGDAYYPGQVLVNTPPDAAFDDQLFRGEAPYTLTGDYPPARYLTAVLNQAGGIKPTADIENIRLVRGGVEQVIDLSGVLTGELVDDVPLIAGDQVVVPALEELQPYLMRPSQITPATVKLFVANQTAPSNIDRLDQEEVELEYGTRFSQVAIAMRCAGGTRPTNARRRIALIRTNALSGETEVFDHKVEELLRESVDGDGNPFLMPSDGVVCYDSKLTNISRILNFVGSVLNPIRILTDIFDN